ncbi:MAG: response regulator [Bacillota bacterium]
MRKKNILLLSKTNVVEFRFKKIFEKYDYNLIISKTKFDALRQLNQYHKKLDLFILDLDEGKIIYDYIDELKERKLKKPIALLSSENNKKEFIKTLKLGINEYIVKPFDNKRIEKTLNKYLKNDENDKQFNPHLIKDYKEEIQLEIKKAKKGKYSISFVLLTFDGKFEQSAKNLYMRFLRKKLWDTDEAFFFKNNSILCFFPFSGLDEKDILSKKLKKYNRQIIMNSKKYDDCKLTLTFNIFPEHIDSFDQLIEEIKE